MRFVASTVANLHHFASRLASQSRFGDVYCLFGDIGAGKTEFCRGFIRSLFASPRLTVDSPTYTIEKIYEGSDDWKKQNQKLKELSIHHIDLYRLQNPQHIAELDFFSERSKGIYLIEWSENMNSSDRPSDRIDVHLHNTDESDARVLTLIAHGEDWTKRLRAIVAKDHEMK
eukprot:TRINITY_DN11067_c0_g1_i1.p1 TRINITY_DN11067_c0_g1~~TRINITY_DN11067_c0_g1_i1.p1  ORF type:complete len:172 (+),score=36.42 TRINITY_DN11067_c0_g1_i1:70-585(+)